MAISSSGHTRIKADEISRAPKCEKGSRKIKNSGEYFFWSGLGNPKSCVGDWQRTFRRLSKLSAFISTLTAGAIRAFFTSSVGEMEERARGQEAGDKYQLAHCEVRTILIRSQGELVRRRL